MTNKVILTFFVILNSLIGLVLFYLIFPYQVIKVDDISQYKPGLFDRFYKIVIVQQPLKVISDEYEDGLPVVYKGEPILIELQYIKYIDVTTNYDRYIVCKDGNLQPLSNFEGVYQPVGDWTGDNRVVAKSNILPEFIETGKCKIVFPTEYVVNSINTVNTTVESDWFYAREATASASKVE